MTARFASAHRKAIPSLGLCAALCLTSRFAAAEPAQASAQGQANTNSASGSTSRKGFKWPERIVAGNAISFVGPLQFGLVDYLPRARFALQYDRQLEKGHWLFLGIGVLFDRGNYNTFKSKCGFEDASGDIMRGFCEKGGVVGIDIYAGYVYRFYSKKHPYVVPMLRAAVGYSWWKLPNVGSSREQQRDHSWALTGRPGAGLRVFPWQDLGFGLDVNLPMGLAVHTDQPPDGEEDQDSEFLLGIEVLPLVVEYRF